MNTTTSSLAPVQQSTSVELAASSAAALAKATIEAKFVIALRPENRRVIQDIQAQILDACRRPRFAEAGWYRKKQGQKLNKETGQWEDNYVEGFSIRFAETAIQAWRSVDVSATTVWEDATNRQIRVIVTDLQTNISYTDDAMLSKTVERKKLRDGQVALGRRQTTEGSYVYIVQCTDEELQNKVNAAKSRAVRNSGLRLIPADILDEARDAIAATRVQASTSSASRQKIIDSFAGIGVTRVMLEQYLRHSIDQITTKEWLDLRSVYTAIHDGDATWEDYVTEGSRPSDAGAQEQTAAPPVPPATSPATPPAPAEEPKGTQTPQQELAAILIGADLTFSDLVAWGGKSKNIQDPTSLTCFDDVPTETAKRLLRASKGLVTQIRAMKNPNAV